MKNLFSFKLPSQWTKLPMIYKGDQIVAEISSWTNTSRIWVNDEIVDQRKGWRFESVDQEKVSKVHEFRTSNGERVSLTLGYSLSDGMLFCSAEADGTVFYEKNFSDIEPKPSSEKSHLLALIPAGVAGGAMGYFVTQLILGAL